MKYLNLNYKNDFEFKNSNVNSTTRIAGRKVPPSFAELPKDVVVNPGESTNLTCAGSGSPAPIIMWKRDNDEPIEDTRTSNGKNVLEVRDIWKSENFTCMLQSELGNVEHTVRVVLRGKLFCDTVLKLVSTFFFINFDVN